MRTIEAVLLGGVPPLEDDSIRLTASRVQAHHRRADIQGLRGLAVLLVVAFHAGLPLPGGFVGVDVFFVISGFVITGLLLRSLADTGGIGMVDFYSRRIRRLLPALALTVVVTCLLGMLFLSPVGVQEQTARTGAAAAVFSSNLQLMLSATGYFDLPAGANPLLHLWSLSLEEQFYLAYPAAVLITWRLAVRWAPRWSPRVVLAAVLALATLVSFGSCLVLTARQPKIGFYSLPTRAWELTLGAVLCLAAPRLARLPRRAAAPVGIAGLALVALAALRFGATTRYPGAAAVIPVGGSALVLAAGTGGVGSVTRVLGHRSLARIGDVSYGWYLWHWPAIVMVRSVLPQLRWLPVGAALGSLGLAIVSYRAVEEPLRTRSWMTGTRVVPVAAAGIVVPLLAAAGLGVVTERIALLPEVRVAAVQGRPHLDETRGCMSVNPLGDDTFLNCTWRAPASRGKVVLIGDSNAGQFAEPVIAAANEQGLDVQLATNGGCPFADVLIENSAVDAEVCHRFVTGSVDHLRATRPNLVVIASVSTRYLREGNGMRLRDPRTGEVAESVPDRARLWQAGLASTLRALNEAGVPVVLVHAVPQFEEPAAPFDLMRCPTIRLVLDTCGTSLTRAQVAEQQHAAGEAEQDAAASVSATRTVDFTDEVCNSTSCATRRDDRWLYRDRAHLSVDGATALTERWHELIGTQHRG